MRVLSLFDGMACGMIAFTQAGIEVESYDAFEYDEESANESKGRPYGFAAMTASHNFPIIQQHGDVFKADFTKYRGVDFVIGGSPCTYWSIAQKNNRETEASGMGWELFQQYVRAIKEAEPRFFIYENNKSMHESIRASIDEAFGFEAVCINSALVSAQHRQRLYWVGKRNPDGTYSKVEVDQPTDRGLLLRDILEYADTDKEKARCVTGSVGRTTTREYFVKHQNTMAAEPLRVGALPRPNGELSGSQAMRVYDAVGKSVNLTAGGGGMGGKTGLYAIPVNTTVEGKSYMLPASYYKAGENPFSSFGNETRRPRVAEQVPWGANPVEWDENGRPTKATSTADGKVYTVYEVKDGQITIKGKQYPIKLVDGFYIIRKLTVTECKRLQTVPEWYDMSVVSDTQAYKMLGNGWTVEVIVHLIQSALCVVL